MEHAYISVSAFYLINNHLNNVERRSRTVQWLMTPNTSFSHRLRNASLYIDSARGYDEGVYVCVASNTLGQSRNSSVLRVAGNMKPNVGMLHTPKIHLVLQ